MQFLGRDTHGCAKPLVQAQSLGLPSRAPANMLFHHSAVHLECPAFGASFLGPPPFLVLALGFSSCCAPARDGSPRPLLFPSFLPVPSHCLNFLFPSDLSLKSCRHERPECFRPTAGTQSFGNEKNQGDGPSASSQPAVPRRSSAVDSTQLRPPPPLNPTKPQ